MFHRFIVPFQRNVCIEYQHTKILQMFYVSASNIVPIIVVLGNIRRFSVDAKKALFLYLLGVFFNKLKKKSIC